MKTDPVRLHLLSDTDPASDSTRDAVWLDLDEDAWLVAPTDIADKLAASPDPTPVVIDIVGQMPFDLRGWTLWLD